MTKPKSRMSDRVDKFPPLFWWILAFAMVLFVWNMARGAECPNGTCPVQTTPAIVPGPLGKLRVKQVVPLVPAKIQARYGWFKQAAFQPTTYGGVAGEVLSRVPSNEWYRCPDIGTVTHETCHGLNSNARNSMGLRTRQSAAYMPGGYILLLPHCGLRMVDFAQDSRGLHASFNWSDGSPLDALELLDEYSCYLCGMAARIENPRLTDSLPSGDYKRGRWLENDIRRLRNALAQRKWPWTKQLDELLAYGHSQYEAYVKRIP